MFCSTDVVVSFAAVVGCLVLSRNGCKGSENTNVVDNTGMSKEKLMEMIELLATMKCVQKYGVKMDILLPYRIRETYTIDQNIINLCKKIESQLPGDTINRSILFCKVHLGQSLQSWSYKNRII